MEKRPFQFSLRMMLAAVVVAAIMLGLYRLGPPTVLAFAAFLAFVVCPLLIVGQPDLIKGVLVYVTFILCFGGLCHLIAASI